LQRVVQVLRREDAHSAGALRALYLHRQMNNYFVERRFQEKKKN
jgi:hypothetical protein